MGQIRGRRRREHGLNGEKIAKKLLKSAGYTVRSGRSGRSHVIVDGERLEFPLHCDLIAERRGRRFLVEVKTGRRRSPTLDTTRRQLLEYWLSFDTDGVLLVDAEERRIQTIHFDYSRP
ncbi:MAG: Holliday junction resolvase-like predicted endonuclease [Myxococcota bacterium]|jgi:Holliday junction resolvase-like predicted endonuclease